VTPSWGQDVSLLSVHCEWGRTTGALWTVLRRHEWVSLRVKYRRRTMLGNSRRKGQGGGNGVESPVTTRRQSV